MSSSVFNNPYREAENYEQSLLEQHVKMTAVKKEIKDAKRKKICFKFNKGKCRLGDKCRFLHSYLPNTEQNASDCEDETVTESKKPVKKRCGLTDNLVPPKKYMQSYRHSK